MSTTLCPFKMRATFTTQQEALEAKAAIIEEFKERYESEVLFSREKKNLQSLGKLHFSSFKDAKNMAEEVLKKWKVTTCYKLLSTVITQKDDRFFVRIVVDNTYFNPRYSTIEIEYDDEEHTGYFLTIEVSDVPVDANWDPIVDFVSQLNGCKNAVWYCYNEMVEKYWKSL